MKMFYKIALSAFALGLVLMGVGVGVQIMEISSLSYMGDKYTDNDNLIVKRIEITLPDNEAKIYNYDSYSNLNVVKDDSLTGNNAIIDVKHSAKENVNVVAYCEDNYHLYNAYTDSSSKNPVNVIHINVDRELISEVNGLDSFKEVLADFKNKEIYNYNYYGQEPEITVRMSAEAFKRYSLLPDGYDIDSYGQYTQKIADKTNYDK